MAEEFNDTEKSTLQATGDKRKASVTNETTKRRKLADMNDFDTNEMKVEVGFCCSANCLA